MTQLEVCPEGLMKRETEMAPADKAEETGKEFDLVAKKTFRLGVVGAAPAGLGGVEELVFEEVVICNGLLAEDTVGAWEVLVEVTTRFITTGWTRDSLPLSESTIVEGGLETANFAGKVGGATGSVVSGTIFGLARDLRILLGFGFGNGAIVELGPPWPTIS